MSDLAQVIRRVAGRTFEQRAAARGFRLVNDLPVGMRLAAKGYVDSQMGREALALLGQTNPAALEQEILRRRRQGIALSAGARRALGAAVLGGSAVAYLNSRRHGRPNNELYGSRW